MLKAKRAVGDETFICLYVLLEPVLCRRRHVDGTSTLVRFGIGETVRVVEPSCCLLVGGLPDRTEVPLDGGDVLFALPCSIRCERH